MATYKPGLTGPLRGTVGTVSASSWKSLSIIKSLPKKSTKPSSTAQMDQRSLFSLVIGFLRNISDIISIGYQAVQGDITGMNKAVKYHLQNAVTGIYPNYALDYSKIEISNRDAGTIENGWDPKLIAEVGRYATVSWEIFQYSQFKLNSSTDQCYLVFYNVTKKKFVVVAAGVDRSELTMRVHLPLSFVGDKLHGYMYFASVDAKRVSDSAYLGEITIVA